MVGKNDGNIFALIPAAGAGTRMGGQVPKQYLSILGKTILEHTLSLFVNNPKIKRPIVAVSEDDELFSSLPSSVLEKCTIITGGAERRDSVMAGLNYLRKFEPDCSWVLVHDAARPCVQHRDIDNLIEAVKGHPVGGLLAAPVLDTVKECTKSSIVKKTVDRSNLWRALTPQMFRLTVLQKALAMSIENGTTVTDESQAIEEAGFSSKVVEGSGQNIKVTRPEDLWLAEAILSHHKSLKGN
jgi:2-C-methyl-D-erythritol 4-phosphate cytidylyltransferase